MFLIDNILFSPIHGVLWVFEKIRKAVEEEQANEAESITARLSEMYMMLETGQMTEAEFDADEKTLLDRLDVLKERDAGGEKDEAREGDEDDEESPAHREDV